MTTIAIELNDAGFLAVDETNLLVGPSPGYALLDGKSLLVGAEAQAMARLKPRWIDHRFWDQLDSSSMPKPFPHSLSRADVAHAHLSKFWEEVGAQLGAQAAIASVLLAVPGSFSVEQMGLILGISRACEIPVSGIVDAAVAAASRVQVGPRVLHLDILLHRVVWTELDHDGELVRRRVETLEGHGTIAFGVAWAKHIAGLLVRQTRFDPLHHGQAEQTLFDMLAQWLERLTEDARVEVNLESGGKGHAVELTADSIAVASGSLLAPIVEMGQSLASVGELPSVLVSRRASTIPGLAVALSGLPCRGFDRLEEGSAAAGALANRGRIESSGTELPFINRLPADLHVPLAKNWEPSPPGEAGLERFAPTPTHILLAGTAYVIDTEALWLGSSLPEQGRGLVVAEPMPGLSRRHCAVCWQDGKVIVEDHSSFGTYLNGRRIDQRAAAGVGDRLRLGSPGVELELIVVEADV